MDEVQMTIMVPAPAVWLAVLALVGPITYGVLSAGKGTARALGRRYLGWKSDPPWNGLLQGLSLVIGAALGYALYHFLEPTGWPWGVGIGAVAGLLNIALFGVVKKTVTKKVAQAIIGMEARKAEDTLDAREDEGT